VALTNDRNRFLRCLFVSAHNHSYLSAGLRHRTLASMSAGRHRRWTRPRRLGCVLHRTQRPAGQVQ